jgi:hypothetical protein
MVQSVIPLAKYTKVVIECGELNESYGNTRTRTYVQSGVRGEFWSIKKFWTPIGGTKMRPSPTLDS